MIEQTIQYTSSQGEEITVTVEKIALRDRAYELGHEEILPEQPPCPSMTSGTVVSRQGVPCLSEDTGKFAAGEDDYQVTVSCEDDQSTHYLHGPLSDEKRDVLASLDDRIQPLVEEKTDFDTLNEFVYQLLERQ